MHTLILIKRILTYIHTYIRMAFLTLRSGFLSSEVRVRSLCVQVLLDIASFSEINCAQVDNLPLYVCMYVRMYVCMEDFHIYDFFY